MREGAEKYCHASNEAEATETETETATTTTTTTTKGEKRCGLMEQTRGISVFFLPLLLLLLLRLLLFSSPLPPKKDRHVAIHVAGDYP
jgi:hypothetical protein